MGDVEKSSFYCFARQRGPQWANALKTVRPTLEGVVRSYSVQGAGCNQLMDNSRIGWHQGEVSSIVNLLVPTSLGSMWLWSAVFIWWVSFLYKQLRNVCQAFICVFLGNWEFPDSAMWQNYSLNCYQFPSPTAIVSTSSHLPIIHS